MKDNGRAKAKARVLKWRIAKQWDVDRRKPYTQIGISRLKCIRCGGTAWATWNICADGGKFRPLCKACDVSLNRLVLEWAGHPETERLMAEYEKGLLRG